jgi:hypothetical protein
MMSRRTDEARQRGRDDGAAAYAARRVRPAEVYRRGRLRRAYIEGWDAGWWTAGFAEVAAISDRVTAKIPGIVAQFSTAPEDQT